MPGKTIPQLAEKIKQFLCMKNQKIKFSFYGHFFKSRRLRPSDKHRQGLSIGLRIT